MAMNVGRIIMSFFVSSWMIIHLGMKPDRGGRPPSDIISTRISDAMRGNLFHVLDSDSVVVDELCMNSMNVLRVIVM